MLKENDSKQLLCYKSHSAKSSYRLIHYNIGDCPFTKI